MLCCPQPQTLDKNWNKLLSGIGYFLEKKERKKCTQILCFWGLKNYFLTNRPNLLENFTWRQQTTMQLVFFSFVCLFVCFLFPNKSVLYICRKKEVQVYKERGKHESLKEKISRLEEESSKLREERDRAEEKLLEISNESVQVSCKLLSCALHTVLLSFICSNYTAKHLLFH